MSNQSPAEALRQQHRAALTYYADKVHLHPEKAHSILNEGMVILEKAAAAYAATVEREADTKARIDELWEILDYVTTTSYDTSTGQKMDKYINDRLAALRGPIQE